MTSIFVTIYLVLGGLLAAGYALLIDKSLKERGHNPEFDAAVDMNERAVGGLPGGMPTALVAITLLWPAAVWILIRNAVRRQGR